MRKLLLFVAAMICLNVQGFAYDFYALNDDGVIMYYNFTLPHSVIVSNGDEDYSGNVIIPASVVHCGTNYSVIGIGTDAFNGCSSLTSVNIPNSVIVIGGYAFSGCSSLTSVNIPNSVISIEDYAFYRCSSLTSITIPNSVTSIGSRAFEETGYYNNTSNWTDGVLYIGNCLIHANQDLPDEYTIIDGTTCIAGYAFDGCSRLSSVNIPNSVTSIGSAAFYGCSSLTSIIIPNSVTSIGSSAFKETGYYNNTTNWTDGVLYMENFLIRANQDLSGDYSVNDGVKYIAEDAFEQCRNITSITIPNSVTSIGSGAFSDCTGLFSITIPNSVTSIGSSAFYRCSSLASFIVAEGNPSFETMENGRFLIENTDNEKILMAFAPSGISSITIPNAVTIIGYAFGNCSSLTSIIIPSSVTVIGAGAFYHCNNMVSVTIPNSVTIIGRNAFRYCSSLTSVNIPNSVTSIGGYAFNECSGLTSVNIGSSVANIGRRAFEDCTGLTSINSYAMTPPAYGYEMFSNIPINIPVQVPCGCGDAYRAAAEWSNFTNIIEMSCDVEITVSASPATYGTVSGGGSYTSGVNVTVTATANEGYHFESWTEDGNVVSTNATYSFTAISSQNLVANFAPGTGLEEESLQNFAIYPNPTSGIVNLDVEDVQYVEIMDFNGRIISKILNTNNIDLSDFDKGIYILRISLPQGSTMRRVVKM